jgi:citrate/tricarballylate utilization protein
LWSLPKLLGLPGGILLCVGTAMLLALKSKSDTTLDARAQNGLDTGFTLLLFLVGLSGLLLYALRSSALMTPMLALHLGAVLAFFVTLPYSKMVHGFYRFATLVRAAQEARTMKPMGGGSG